MQYRGAKFSVKFCRVERHWHSVVWDRDRYWLARWEAILDVAIYVDRELASRGAPNGRFVGTKVQK